MKKLLIATIALTGLCFSSFAQTTAKKTTPPTLKVEKKMTARKEDAKVIQMKTSPKVVAPAATKVVSKTAVTKTTIKKPNTKPVTTTVTKISKPVVEKTNGTVKLKKDGTPDKRFKKAQATVGPLKKDGTPDHRYKANKKS